MSETHDSIKNQLNDYELAKQLQQQIDAVIENLSDSAAKVFEDQQQIALEYEENQKITVLNKQLLRLVILTSLATIETNQYQLTDCLKIVLKHWDKAPLICQLPPLLVFMVAIWHGKLEQALSAFNRMTHDEKANLFTRFDILENIMLLDQPNSYQGLWQYCEKTTDGVKLLLTMNHFARTGDDSVAKNMWSSFISKHNPEKYRQADYLSRIIYMLFRCTVEFGHINACKKFEGLFTAQKIPPVWDELSNTNDAFGTALCFQPENKQLLNWLWQRIPKEKKQLALLEQYFKRPLNRNHHIIPVKAIPWVLSKCGNYRDVLIKHIRYENYFSSAIEKYGIDSGFWLIKNNIAVAGERTFISANEVISYESKEKRIQLIKYIVDTADEKQAQLINKQLGFYFTRALEFYDMDIVRLCIELGFDVKQKQTHNILKAFDFYPLWLACNKYNLDAVSLLLDKGADPNCLVKNTVRSKYQGQHPLLFEAIYVEEEHINQEKVPKLYELEKLLVFRGALINPVRKHIEIDQGFSEAHKQYLLTYCDELEKFREQCYQVGRVTCIMKQAPCSNIFSQLTDNLQKLICIDMVSDQFCKIAADSIYDKRVTFIEKLYKERSKDKLNEFGKRVFDESDIDSSETDDSALVKYN